MTTMVLTRPAERERHGRCVRLTAGPAAAAEARRQVREAIRAWRTRVDLDIAVLLTSDLVTHAIRYGAGETITLAVRCDRGQLRVDVFGTSRSRPAQADASATPKIGQGLILVATLSDGWGCFRTPAGLAGYFTLAFRGERP